MIQLIVLDHGSFVSSGDIVNLEDVCESLSENMHE